MAKVVPARDIAYCLMGLFDVNMPLLYGEGNKAFLRLQEEIMKLLTDHTLFVWSAPKDGNNFIDCGLLAPRPEYFTGSSRFVNHLPTAVARVVGSVKPYFRQIGNGN